MVPQSPEIWGSEAWGGSWRTPIQMTLDSSRDKSPRATSLTIQILIPDSPGLGRVKVGVPSDVGAWEVGMGQEATLAIERRAVTVETLSKEDHDIGLLLVALTDVGIGYLSEVQRRGTLPHTERLADGLERGILPHLGGVVLDAEVQPRGERMGVR